MLGRDCPYIYDYMWIADFPCGYLERIFLMDVEYYISRNSIWFQSRFWIFVRTAPKSPMTCWKSMQSLSCHPVYLFTHSFFSLFEPVNRQIYILAFMLEWEADKSVHTNAHMHTHACMYTYMHTCIYTHACAMDLCNGPIRLCNMHCRCFCLI